MSVDPKILEAKVKKMQERFKPLQAKAQKLLADNKTLQDETKKDRAVLDKAITVIKKAGA